MIIQGYFIGDAPYFSVHLRHEEFEGAVWLLADTGASRTTLLDRDVGLLGLPSEALARHRFRLWALEEVSARSCCAM